MLGKRRRDGRPTDPLAAGGAPILDQYVREAPSAQQTVDVFAGEWSSSLPERLAVQSGGANLFADRRITWLIDQLGGVNGTRVIELGPDPTQVPGDLRLVKHAERLSALTEGATPATVPTKRDCNHVQHCLRRIIGRCSHR